MAIFRTSTLSLYRKLGTAVCRCAGSFAAAQSNDQEHWSCRLNFVLSCLLPAARPSCTACKKRCSCNDSAISHFHIWDDAVQAEFWASQGQVLVTEAVGFVLAGQDDAAAIQNSLTNYLKLLDTVGRSSTSKQQLQLLQVSQGIVKQSAQTMREYVGFQIQMLDLLQQLLQVRFTLLPVSHHVRIGQHAYVIV